MLTVIDLFCGAGGSSSGMEQVPGVRVRFAVNHWALAIETHNTNMPHVDHDTADLRKADPGKYPTTDLGWFSPECTWWSQARGEKTDYDYQQPSLLDAQDEDDEPESESAKWRSRLQMTEVIEFARKHKYKGFVVENVTDILKWRDLDRWLGELHAEGYQHHIVILNSAFAAALGPGAPQFRDRIYFVFWRAGQRRPDFDKWTRPRAYCPNCERDVVALYSPKPGKRRAMRYGQQYGFRCPSVSCRGGLVRPYALPAAAAIDWAVPGRRIGDRDKPLRPKTLARIEAGLRRYGRPITLEAAGHTFERRPGVRTWPVDRPMTAQHTTASKALACPPMLVPSGGTWNDDASSVEQPMRARTTKETEAICVPPFLAVLRTNATTQRISEPLGTFTAGGGHHGLVQPMLVPTEGRENVFARGVGQPMRAQTARHETALVVPLRNNGVTRPADSHPLPTFAAGGQHHALIYGYDTGDLRPIAQPLPTQTTVQGDALLEPAVAVDDCTFRMLEVDEIRAGMAFTPGYVLLGAKRDRVRMLGNAVTPPAARDLIAALAESITGESIEVPA